MDFFIYLCTIEIKQYNMNCDICYNFFTRLYYATLLGGEFANCYGQGSTPKDATISLKIRMIQLRNKK